MDEVQGRLRSLAGAWKADLGPRRHAIAESIRLKGDLTSDEGEGAAVWLVMFLRDETCKSLEGNRGRRTPTSTCGQDQWSKGTMLHLEDTVFVCSPFLTFMSSVASIRGDCAV